MPAPETEIARLSELESAARSSADWLACAAAWQRLDLDSACRCVDQAQAAATSVDDWLSIAEFRGDGGWIMDQAEIRGEPATELAASIVRCMAQAEARAADAREWFACALQWFAMDGQATNPRLARLLASMRGTLAEGEPGMRRCMARAAACSASLAELERIAMERLGEDFGVHARTMWLGFKDQLACRP